MNVDRSGHRRCRRECQDVGAPVAAAIVTAKAGAANRVDAAGIPAQPVAADFDIAIDGDGAICGGYALCDSGPTAAAVAAIAVAARPALPGRAEQQITVQGHGVVGADRKQGGAATTVARRSSHGRSAEAIGMLLDIPGQGDGREGPDRAIDLDFAASAIAADPCAAETFPAARSAITIGGHVDRPGDGQGAVGTRRADENPASGAVAAIHAGRQIVAAHAIGGGSQAAAELDRTTVEGINRDSAADGVAARRSRNRTRPGGCIGADRGCAIDIDRAVADVIVDVDIAGGQALAIGSRPTGRQRKIAIDIDRPGRGLRAEPDVRVGVEIHVRIKMHRIEREHMGEAGCLAGHCRLKIGPVDLQVR